MVDSFNDVVSGFQAGFSWGQQLQDRRRQQESLAALGRTYEQGQPPPQQPQPRPSVPPSMQPQPPMTMQGVQAPQLSAGGGAPQPTAMAGNPQAGMAAPPPQPSAPMQPPQPAPDPNLSATAQPGAMGMDDPGMAAAQTLQSIGRAIKQANPKIDPMTLAMAVSSQVEQIKGIAPLTRSYMTMQTKAMEMQVRSQWAYQRFQQNEEKIRLIADKQEQERAHQANIDQWHHDMLLETETRDSYAHEDRQASIGQRDTASQRSLEGREYAADSSAGAREYAADSGAAGKDASTLANAWNSAYSAAIRQGKNPKAAAQYATASLGAAGAVVRGTRGRTGGGGGGARPTGPISRNRPVSGGGGGGVPAGEQAYLRAHRGDQNVVQQFVGRYGKAAVDAAMR